MSWRAAKSLLTLRDQYNDRFPNRSKRSDGIVGDLAHQSRVSDHNPDANGVVHALDITHDPDHSLNIAVEVERLAASGDGRIKYLIANRRIWEPGKGWQPYGGTNPHTDHMHISVRANNGDDPNPWNIFGETAPGGERIKAGTTWNVRTAPSANASRIGIAVGGQAYDTVRQPSGWRQVTFKGQVGYIAGEAFVGSVAPVPGPTPSPSHVETVKTGTWNVRMAPSLSASLRDGNVLGGQKYDTEIVAGGWRKISFRGAVGFVGPKAW